MLGKFEDHRKRISYLRLGRQYLAPCQSIPKVRWVSCPNLTYAGLQRPDPPVGSRGPLLKAPRRSSVPTGQRSPAQYLLGCPVPAYSAALPGQVVSTDNLKSTRESGSGNSSKEGAARPCSGAPIRPSRRCPARSRRCYDGPKPHVGSPRRGGDRSGTGLGERAGCAGLVHSPRVHCCSVRTAGSTVIALRLSAVQDSRSENLDKRQCAHTRRGSTLLQTAIRKLL